MMLTLDKVKYKNRGNYNPTVAYQFNDAVLFGGSSYSALSDITGQAPLITKGIANNTTFIVTHTNTIPTTGGYRFEQKSPTTSIWDVSSSTNNPTLNLVRGYTYKFDCSQLTESQALCLVRTLSEITATPKTSFVAGALRNNIWVGVYQNSKQYNTIENSVTNQRKPFTTANKSIVFNVPLYSNTVEDNTAYYTAASTANATYGTILLWSPSDKVFNSQYWALIVKSSDETNDQQGSIPVQVSSGPGLLSPGIKGQKFTVNRSNLRSYVANNYGPSGGIIVGVPGSRYTTTYTDDLPVSNNTGQYFEIAPTKWAGTDADPTRTWSQSSLQSSSVSGALLCHRIGDGYTNTQNIISQGNSSASTSAAKLAATFGASSPSSFTITNSGSSGYSYNSITNPNLYLVRGRTYEITINASGHPFWIQSLPVLASSTQPTAYDSSIVYNTGVTNNGAAVGVIQFTVPIDCPQLMYVCQNHSSMRGRIVVMDAEYTDWYLPTRDEFSQLVNNSQVTVAGIDNTVDYWTSTQSSTGGSAFQFNFASASVGATAISKATTLSVRPIRKFFATGTPSDASWNTNHFTQPQTTLHADGGREFNSTTPFALTTENSGRLPFQMQTPSGAVLMSRSGFDPGRGPIFIISSDRRSLKSAGYQYYNCLGYNAQSSEWSEATYPGNRYNMTPQYCQFDSIFADDEWIKFVRRNDNMAIVVTNRGRVYFTGYNDYGQLGLGDTNSRRCFTRNFDFGDTEGRTVVDAWLNRTSGGTSSTVGSTMLVTLEGELYGTGYNGYYNLGDGTSTARANFVRIGETTLNKNGTKIRGMFYNECNYYEAGGIAWTELNEIYGWGNNDSGWLAQNNVSQYASPVRMTQLETLMGSGHYPLMWAVLQSNTNTQTSRNMWGVLSTDGRIYTVGRASQGQHGQGISDSSSTYQYAEVARPTGKIWSKLYGGGGETGTFYAITTDGNLYAWGYNGYGNFGTGNTTSSNVPVLASNLPSGFAGNVERIWVTGHDNYVHVWVKTTTNRYCTFGYNSNGIGMRSSQAVNDGTWWSTSHPLEVTNFLPYNGKGLVTFNPYHYQSSSNNGTIAIEYSNGEIFTFGGTQSRGENPASGDGTNSSQGSNYGRSHAQLVTNFWL